MNTNPQLKSAYPLIVWIITLLIGPIAWIGYKILENGYAGGIGMVDLLPPMILLSIFMSLPTLLVTVIAFLITRKITQDPNVIRLVIVLIVLIGIWVSFYQLGGASKVGLSISYSIAALIAVLLATPKKNHHLL